MKKFGWSVVVFLLIAESFPCRAAPARKRNISIGEARAAVGVVAAYQQFPAKFSLSRLGSVQAGDEYYHVFATYLSKSRRWRTLVFANSGAYLGYYASRDQPVELEREGIVFPGRSYSVESGDDEEGEFDYGDARIIKFSPSGPPDEVKFEKKTFEFISSPMRVRPESPGFRFVQTANRVADAINRGRYKRVRDDFSEGSLHRISEVQTVEVLSGVRDKLGRIEHVGAPWIQSSSTAVLPVTFERAVAGLKLTLTTAGKIDGLWVLPFKTAFPDIGKNQTVMRLPVKGQWRLMWGGGRSDQSKYFGNRVSHYALELVVSTRFGKTYKNEGRHVGDYFAYGQQVVAPAAGTVVAVINGVKDNRPHYPDPFDRLGNAVMIEHSTNEYSVVGHLKPDSIRVRKGDPVEAGQVIALCGNSGDSSQPCLYFHLQDSPELLSGSGYRTVFSNLYIEKSGQTVVVEEYAPVRGDFVQQRVLPQKTVPSGQGGKVPVAGE